MDKTTFSYSTSEAEFSSFDHRPIGALSDAEFRRLKGEELHATRLAEKKPYAMIQTLSQIKRKEISWLWPGRIALGKLTLIAGDPGISKSLLTVDLAARISTGFPFPDNAPAPRGDTLFLSLEDDAADTIRPRLEAARADLDRCHILQGKIVLHQENKTRSSLVTLKNIDILKDALYQIAAQGGNPQLIIVDPVDSFQGGIDSNSNDVRELLTPLAEFADQEHVAVILVKHLNKNQQTRAAYRVNGHISYTAVVRSSWMVIKSPQNPEERLFLCMKNNLGKDNSGLRYRIAEDSTGTPFLDWSPEPITDEIEVLLSRSQAPQTGSVERDDIINFLHMNGQSSPGEIATGLGKSSHSVSNMLKKLEGDGHVRRVQYGLWECTSYPSETTGDESDDSDESSEEKSPESSESLTAHRGTDDGNHTIDAETEISRDRETVPLF